MRYLIVFLIQIACLPALQAQILQVNDVQTSEPLSYVSITDQLNAKFTLSDQDGRADLSTFEPGDTLVLQIMGFNTIRISYADLQAQAFKIDLEPSVFSFDQIMISANRWSQRRSNYPGKIRQLSQKEFQSHHPQTAADLLESTGEVFIQKSQMGGGSPMIRGFSANRLLYAVDGVRMNTAIFRSGNVHNVISLDPFSVESTEIVYGPGAILYGSDAIGAVMAFQTKQAQFSERGTLLAKGNAELRLATANQEFTGHFDLNLGTKKWAFLTSFTWNEFGDLKMGSHGPEEFLRNFRVIQTGNRQDTLSKIIDPRIQVPTSYDQINFLQKIAFQANPYLRIDYAFHHSQTTNIPRFDRLIELTNGAPSFAEWYYGPQKWMMNYLSLAYAKPSKWFDKMRLVAAQQLFEESRLSRRYKQPTRIVQEEQVQAYSINLDFNKAISPKMNLFYGLEGLLNQVQSAGSLENIFGESRGSTVARYPEADWWSAALYGNLELRSSPQWLWRAGLRLNYFGLSADFTANQDFLSLPFSSTAFDKLAFNGSLGFVFKPEFSWQLHTNFSTGFRSPNVDDIGKVFDSEPGAVVVPNPALNPEYAYNFELGLEKIFSERFFLDISAYYTHLDDALVRRDFQLAGQDSILYQGILSRVQAIQNASAVDVWGLQFGLEWQVFRHLKWVARYNYQQGKELSVDGLRTPSRHAPPAFGHIEFQYKKKGRQIALRYQFQSTFDFEDLPIGEQNKPHLYALDGQGRPFAPSWYSLDLRTSFQLHPQFQIGLNLENITDQRYRTYSSGIAAPGRNLSLRLKGQF